MEKLASDRVRRHLEQQNRELAELVKQSTRPGYSPRDAAGRLEAANVDLQGLLKQEAAARKEAEDARLKVIPGLSGNRAALKTLAFRGQMLYSPISE